MRYAVFFSVLVSDVRRRVAYRLGCVKRTRYNTMYPFFVLSARGLERLAFRPVTIFYGGNGSGKTTALNIIAEKPGLFRGAL